MEAKEMPDENINPVANMNPVASRNPVANISPNENINPDANQCQNGNLERNRTSRSVLAEIAIAKECDGAEDDLDTSDSVTTLSSAIDLGEERGLRLEEMEKGMTALRIRNESHWSVNSNGAFASGIIQPTAELPHGNLQKFSTSSDGTDTGGFIDSDVIARPRLPGVYSGRLYHERQRLQLCLLHALNCLFQRQEFTKAELDAIAMELDSSYWFNNHRSFLGTGNYDVNVLIAAVESRGNRFRWFDARLSLETIKLDEVLGFVFNAPANHYLPFFAARHWYTVRRILDMGFFNFDSKFPSPAPIMNFYEFASERLAIHDQMMIVYRAQPGPIRAHERWH